MLQQQSSDSVRIFSINRDDVLARLAEIARRLRAEDQRVVSVRVFGSIARGDQTGLSDADVLIVVKGDQAGLDLDLARIYSTCFDLPVPVDILVCSQGHIAQRLRDGEPAVTRIWQESFPLE